MIDITGYKVLEDGTIIGKRGKPLKPTVVPLGYTCVSINGKREYYHRVVATALIPNPENKPCVNHIDGNKKNNHPSNLEWVTYSENNKHAFSIDKRSSTGSQNSMSKLDENDVIEMRKLLEQGVSQKDCSKIYGVHPRYVSLIYKRKRWKHI